MPGSLERFGNKTLIYGLLLVMLVAGLASLIQVAFWHIATFLDMVESMWEGKSVVFALQLTLYCYLILMLVGTIWILTQFFLRLLIMDGRCERDEKISNNVFRFVGSLAVFIAGIVLVSWRWTGFYNGLRFSSTEEFLLQFFFMGLALVVLVVSPFILGHPLRYRDLVSQTAETDMLDDEEASVKGHK